MKRMVGYTFEENVADANLLARMLRTIRDCPRPIIARVHGAAIGGGVGLAAACDIAAALGSAVFSLSEVRLGIIPAVISPFVMEKIGPGHFRRYALTAERFDAREAHRIGLISQVAESEAELDAWIRQTCDSLLANGPQALSACKQVLTEVAGLAWDQVQAKTAQRIAQIRVSSEGQEGLRAFLEKRKPSWAPL
jgi:methylglutaconyl-CoA hydratase